MILRRWWAWHRSWRNARAKPIWTRTSVSTKAPNSPCTRSETTNKDITVPGNSPGQSRDAYKGFLRSSAYYVLGTIQYSREKFAEAEGYFRKSLDAFPSQPDPLAVLRLALSLDKQGEISGSVEVRQPGGVS